MPQKLSPSGTLCPRNHMPVPRKYGCARWPTTTELTCEPPQQLRRPAHDPAGAYAESGPGQRRIATILLTDPDGTAFRSITETAKLADVHQSSLVTFASHIGVKGYPGLVTLCRQHLAAEAQLVERFGRAHEQSGTRALLAATVKHEQQNVKRTFTRISPAQWDTTVDHLAHAERVHILGLRKCLPVAQLMAYLLKLVRPGVHLIAPVTGGLVDELRDMQGNDVFVAISIRRYTADTVRAFEEAKRSGLHTIAS